MERQLAPQALSDDDLLDCVIALVRQSRVSEAEIVAHIAELDARRLYAREACSSTFGYCTEVLHFSEAEAYLRIAAARASRQHPVLLVMLADGRLHLSAIERLAPHLTPENRDAVLARAAHRSKRQVEELVAELAPRPDVPALLRRLPERTKRAAVGGPTQPEGTLARPTASGDGSQQPVASSAEAARSGAPSVAGALRPDGVANQLGRAGGSGRGAERPTVSTELRLDGVGAGTRPAAVTRTVVEPTAPGRYKVQFTAGAELREKLERLQALMRRTVPDADLASIIEQAVSEKLERLEAVRFAKVKRPRATVPPAAAANPSPSSVPSARRIPAATRRAVHARDGGRCRYTDGQGRRCTAQYDLEFHHRHPFGYGGAHTVDNLILLCATHNRMIGEADYRRAGPPGRWEAPPVSPAS